MGIGAGVAAAGVAAAGSIASSSISSSATKDAAKTQAAAADRAAAAQQEQAAQTRSDLAPFQRLGTDTLGQITPNISSYAQPNTLTALTSYSNPLDQAYAEMPGVYTNVGTLPDINGAAAYMPSTTGLQSALPGGMSQAELEATPGYQFTLQQGLQATQNSAAARGLGVSGAALKGAATYATGLANNTYKDQFAIKQQQFANQGTLFNASQQQFTDAQQKFANQQQVYSDMNNANQLAFANQQQRYTNLVGLNTANQGNLTNSYNRLLGLASLGENAAATEGNNAQAAANAAGQFSTSGANAAAAGQIAGGNSIASGINGIGNAFTNYAGIQQLQGNNTLFGGSINGASPTQAGIYGASGYDNGWLSGLQGYNGAGTNTLQSLGFYNPLSQY